MTTIRRHAPLPALLVAASLTLTACSASGSSSATPPTSPASSPSSAAGSPSALAAAPSATPSPQPCTSHSCIIDDAKQLVGSVAKDESVITAMSCEESTVKHLAPGIWSVRCTATYSDGSQVAGIATVLLEQGKITWEPTS